MGVTAGSHGSALASIRLLAGPHRRGRCGHIWAEYDRPDPHPFPAIRSALHKPLEKTTGLLPSLLMGVFFSAGWTPCVGPTLGAILTMAMSGGSIADGALLLTVYSLGLGIPFLLAALLIERISMLSETLLEDPALY